LILFVDDVWNIFILRDDESPDIVLCRIDQMAKNFFFTPF